MSVNDDADLIGIEKVSEIAIEPMICKRRTEVRTRRDGWSIAARTGSLTAHYEHTAMITTAGPVVPTA
jgi:methionyl aminopeptidase